MRRAATLAALIWLTSTAVVLAALPAGLEGQWESNAAGVDGAYFASAKLVGRGSGLEIDIVAPGAPHIAARMTPTARPDVFQVAAARSLFGLFASEPSADPFDGPPLVWARTSAGALIAYHVAVGSDGTLTLARIALEPVETGLEMWVQLRLDGSVAKEWRVVLERVE
jgi:hypothetical protein